MIFINLDTIDVVNNLVKVCDRYNDIYIDIIHGRYTVNGKSILGVCSLMGNIVRIVPDTICEDILDNLTKDLIEIGALVIE